MPSRLKDFLGEVTRFELSSVMISDMGWRADVVLMGMNTAASTTKRLNTNTLKNTQPENAKLKPEGLNRNKQMVADLVRGGHFLLLTQLYRLKNRI